MTDTALVVMARYPEIGKTKTRLARSFGNQHTVELYHAFLTDIAQRLSADSFALHWAYTPASVDYKAFVAELAPLHAENMACFAQQGPDLGARLHHVFQWTQSKGFQKTIVIGSDSPHISLHAIEQARQALDDHDLVLGPAEDGGYYLLAMQQPHDVFSGIPMSTAVVAQMTLEKARLQGLTSVLIESLFDVDEIEDLQRLAQLLTLDHSRAPVTAAYLQERAILHSISSTFPLL